MYDALLDIFEGVVHIINAFAAVVIIFGAGQALVRVILIEMREFLFGVENKLRKYDAIKIDFGHKLALGLEFLLAGDILLLIFVPSTDELIFLGALVTIRIAVNYFLTREIEEEQREVDLLGAIDELKGRVKASHKSKRHKKN